MENFDFGIGWPVEGDENEFFISVLKSECEARKLKFIFIDGTSLEALHNKIMKGEFKLKFYLDMASETFDPKDDFTKFAYSLKDSGTKIVADPDDVKAAADKSITHFDLARAKIPVPYTVLVRNWEPTRRLTDEEKDGMGFPFVIKPALGYGRKGVKIIKEKATLKEIAEARQVSKGDNFLLQEFIEPEELNGDPAWFRIFHLFGEIFPCWWNPVTHVYRHVTLRETDEFKLLPLIRITTEIARITRIDWFSCEIALSKKDKKFVTIDYMNDQCAINPQSKYKDGVPDELIAQIAERMVEKCFQYVRQRFTLGHRAIWFPKIQVRDENV
ncbi:MAG: ATP-grasp domain-containing protein [Candidatus Omnitrophica bacterium]|nr:ATP-grasp domain-containing protein [Candidatus Omnitrophota bacterium]MBU1869006.1 ATP-grasp domain-containing protein [Candidatus Omnitrophota bacterium]